MKCKECKECNSEGFDASVTGKGCTFCDGTEGGCPPSPPEILILDNSGRSTFRQCKKKYFLQIIKGWQSNYGSTALRYGSTWHGIQEGYYKWIQENGWPSDPTNNMKAITAGLVLGEKIYKTESEGKDFYTDYKNFNTAVEVFNDYLDYFKDDKDYLKIIHTEQKFSCSIEPENSLEEKILSKLPPILFTGKIDLCVEMDKIRWLLDHKTTGWYLDKVIAQANRSAQLIGYTYAAKKVLDFEAQGCLCSFAYTGSTKSKVTGLYGKLRIDFRRVPQIFTRGDVEAWKLSFIDTAREINFAKKENLYPESFDNCHMYGPCSYLKLCQQHVSYDKINFDGFHICHWNVLDD